MRRFFPLVMLLLSACGSATPAVRHGPPSPVPTGAVASSPTATPREVQFVVLEARSPHGQMGPEPGAQDAHDRIAIVGLDGVARAKADFTPRPIPVIGPAVPLLQPEARIAGGRVFYADGAGVIRELTRSGVKPVATFTVKPQQEISFSVSPDGARLEASRYTFPPVNPNPSGIGDQFLSNNYRYEVLTASAAGGVKALKTVNGGNEVTQNPEVVAWDATGPIGTRDPQLGTQQGTQGRTLFGHAVHLDESGSPGPILGGSDCSVVSISGDVLLCVDDTQTTYSIRRTNGSVLWAVPPKPRGEFYIFVVLSPDHTRLAYAGGMRGQDGTTLALPVKFLPEGWLDNQTLIGVTGENNQQEMAIVRLANPTVIDDLGFKGEFIGVLP